MKSVLLIAILAVGVYSQGWSGLVLNGTTNCATNCSACVNNGASVSSNCLMPVAG